MIYEDAIKLRDLFVADQDKRHAIVAETSVMTWNCAICTTPNAFWRNHCILCEAPQHGFEDMRPTYGPGWPD